MMGRQLDMCDIEWPAAKPDSSSPGLIDQAAVDLYMFVNMYNWNHAQMDGRTRGQGLCLSNEQAPVWEELTAERQRSI